MNENSKHTNSIVSRPRSAIMLPHDDDPWTEVANEGEALIKAFQSKNGVIYTVLAYTAEAEIQGGSPTLVKRPIRK